MNPRNGKFVERLLATILDYLILSLVILLPTLIFSMISAGEHKIGNTFLSFASLALLIVPLSAIYYAVFTAKYGGTFGKLLFGLRVENRDSNELIDKKRAWYRFTLGYFFSAQLFGLGFWRIIKNEESLAWHDELFFTKVLKHKGSAPGYIALVVILVLIAPMVFLIFKNLAPAF